MGKRNESASLLERPADKVIRKQAERLLRKAGAAVHRLKDPRDTEALHDSRVALRRLRGWFQAFRGELSPGRRRRHELRDLAHSTNEARDAEVSLAWLTDLRHERDMRPAVERFAAELEALRRASYKQVRGKLPGAWHKLAHKLEHSVNGMEAPYSPFHEAFAASLRRYAREFERALARARRRPNASNIHALRVAGKKLRYLVDAVLKRTPAAGRFLDEMKKLHESSGTIQDLQRLRTLSAQAVLRRVDRRRPRPPTARGTGEHPAPGPDALLWIGRAAREEQAERIAAFRKAYLAGTAPRCVQELHKLLARFS